MSFLTPTNSASGRKARQRAINSTRNALDIPLMVSHIDHALRTATLDQYNAGLSWYYDAYDATGGDPTAAGILAALSPGTSWERNVHLADVMRETGDTPHAYGDAIAKARAIRDGQSPDQVLGGRKVRSFYDNILRPHTSHHVTIDRHAVSLALLGLSAEKRHRTATLSDKDLKILARPGAYLIIAACYRTVARRYNLQPHQVQAITWLVWREAKAYDTNPNHLAHF